MGASLHGSERGEVRDRYFEGKRLSLECEHCRLDREHCRLVGDSDLRG